jgi:multicomponent Na+:H+ antiporter subunit E
MLHLLNLGLLLALFWLGLSGHYTPLLLFFGAVSVALVAWLAHRMDVIDHESVPLHLTRSAMTFWPWLMVEIVKSNIDVVRRVLDPRLPIERSIIRVPTGEMSPLRETIYANAITLTPGTVSLDVGDGEVVVHALSREAADAVRAGDMARRVTDMERED